MTVSKPYPDPRQARTKGTPDTLLTLKSGTIVKTFRFAFFKDAEAKRAELLNSSQEKE